MGMAKRIEPALIIQSDRVNDKSISIPFADGIAHPGGFQLFGMTPAIGPDLAPDALVLEEHEHAVGGLYDLKWLGPDENSRNTGRSAVQNRIVTIGSGFRAIARLGCIVPRLGPGSHGRGSCARTAVKALARNSPDEEFIHAG